MVPLEEVGTADASEESLGAAGLMPTGMGTASFLSLDFDLEAGMAECLARLSD